MFSVAGSCMDLHFRLRPSILKFNIKYRNSNLLHLAAKDNDCALFEDLLVHGADINAFFRRETVLMRAIKYSSADLIKLLLKQPDLDIYLKNRMHEDALLYAVIHGTYVIVESVLEQQGLNLDAQYARGRTVLHLAVFWGRIGIAQLLLSRGADRDVKDHHGHSPRDWAFHANRVSMVKVMSSHHVLLSAFGQHILDSGDPPLHQAMAHGFLNAVKQLLREENLNLERHDRNGDTALHLAVRMKSLELLDLLLDHPRINTNATNRDGNTPLWVASRSQCDEITRRFLGHKCVDINFIGGRGKYENPSSSLHHAILRLDKSILQTWLATPGLDVNILAGGQSPLQVAVQLGRIDALKMLLNFRGININARGGDPPLCQAVEKGALEAVQLLVKQGEQLLVNERICLTRDTALCIAARDGNLEIVRALLLHRHLNPNLENNRLEHPLFLAAKRGNLQVVNALLEDGRLAAFTMKDVVCWEETGLVKSAIQKQIDWQEGFHGVRKMDTGNLWTPWIQLRSATPQ
ncbi:uncharacterized protein N7458_008779 [Penicillium daleae]|uniref:Uncharacterized protein n=1 Tax=Penicillium daleae TaxID=63821 RepID=A0AAD6BXY1_9EURO|nr:uncharacterized protein N7458_008779 [Penicillium daleae]KAJ5437781.1 hypothetical protein N7458_008779 [Penicillium daleae]